MTDQIIRDKREGEVKAALWLAIGKIADQTCSEELRGVTASSNFIAALTEYVWAQTQTLATDCEAFAKHRNSKIIETADVLLCTRRNDALQSLLRSEIDEMSKAQQH